MAKIFTAILLLISFPIAAALKGTMDKNGVQLKITVFYAKDKIELDRKVNQIKNIQLDKSQSGITFYSYQDNVCEIFVIQPKRDKAYDLAMLGDEVYHCTHGNYHK